MIVVIVQARMGSSRLPGKVLLPIGGRPMLSYQIERLRRVRSAQRIVVATTDLATDQPIVDFCAAEGVACVRGSEQDVLSRYWQAASLFDASVVVRVTSDCPLLEPELVDDAIAAYREGGAYDYVSNMLQPTWPYGMAVEVFSAAALKDAHAEASDPAEREHVTPFIYWRPQRYRLRSLTRQPDLSSHRWTVDTPEDFRLVSLILEALYPQRPQFSMSDVLALLEQHPDWTGINANVQQKSVNPAREHA